jgi:hypothetical protein
VSDLPLWEHLVCQTPQSGNRGSEWLQASIRMDRSGAGPDLLGASYVRSNRSGEWRGNEFRCPEAIKPKQGHGQKGRFVTVAFYLLGTCKIRPCRVQIVDL